MLIFAQFIKNCAMIKENFIKLYENSFKENWDLPVTQIWWRYHVYIRTSSGRNSKIHLLFQYCSLRRGDKISIIGKNTSRWCIAYLATVTYGAIVVPILQDFKPNDVHHIVNHSESTFLFTSDNIWENLEEEAFKWITRCIFSNRFQMPASTWRWNCPKIHEKYGCSNEKEFPQRLL